jgi:hypothetical protein
MKAVAERRSDQDSQRRRRWIVLVVVALAELMVVLDVTVLTSCRRARRCAVTQTPDSSTPGDEGGLPAGVAGGARPRGSSCEGDQGLRVSEAVPSVRAAGDSPSRVLASGGSVIEARRRSAVSDSEPGSAVYVISSWSASAGNAMLS